MPALIPSTVIAVVKPLLVLHQLGRIVLDVQLERSLRSRRIASADVVVFCRNCRPQYRAILRGVQAAKKPYIYVLDDDLFNLPVTSEVAAHHHDPHVRRQLEEYIVGAQLVAVFSNALARRVRELNPSVALAVGSVDFRTVVAPTPTPGSRPLRIVYATSRVKDDLAHLFVADLQRILDSRSLEVEAHFWGCRIPELSDHPQVRFFDFIPDYDRFLRKFSRFGYDIGLAPLLNDDFHRAKTNNKFREYGACRIAGIYSDVDVYTMCVRHGETGLIVGSAQGAWFEAILRLAHDPALRERIQNRAHEYVREHYSLDRAQETWWALIESVLRDSSGERAVNMVAQGTPASDSTTGPRRSPRYAEDTPPSADSNLQVTWNRMRQMTLSGAVRGLRGRLTEQRVLCRIRIATSPGRRYRASEGRRTK